MSSIIKRLIFVSIFMVDSKFKFHTFYHKGKAIYLSLGLMCMRKHIHALHEALQVRQNWKLMKIDFME